MATRQPLQPASIPSIPHRILMTTDTVGGVWTYAVDLCHALGTKSIEVVLVAIGASPTADQRLAVRGIPTVTIVERPGRLEWMENPWGDIDATSTWLLHQRDRYQPDLVHLNDYAHGHLPWEVPAVVVGHSCVLSWWEAVKGEPAPAQWNEYRQRVTRGLRSASCVVTPTRAMLSSLQRFYGPFRSEEVIFNAADPGAFRRAEKKEDLILTAGRVWDEAKNPAALAAVAPGVSWPIVVAGDDLHPAGGRLSLPGLMPLGRLSRQEISRWYGRAAVYALPARYEPFGLSVLEAALSECALILGDIPTLRELWEGAALFVPPTDTHALCEVIGQLTGDTGLRITLGRESRNRGLSYSPARMLEGYLNLYGRLISGIPASGLAKREIGEAVGYESP